MRTYILTGHFKVCFPQLLVPLNFKLSVIGRSFKFKVRIRDVNVRIKKATYVLLLLLLKENVHFRATYSA